MKNKKIAFTLIELLVVMVVISLLATVSIATFGGNKEKARIAKNTAECVQEEKCNRAIAICEANGITNCNSLCDLSQLDCDEALYAQTRGGISSESYPPESEWTDAACFIFNAGTITDYSTSCNGLAVVIPLSIEGETVTAIGNAAFHKNQLTSVTIPGSVLTIGTTAFQENQLTSITLSEGTTTLSRNAFYGNNLTSVTIPDSVSSIGDYAFYNNPLASASVDSGTSFSHNSFPVGCTLASGCVAGRGIANGGNVPESCFIFNAGTITDYSTSCNGLAVVIPSSIEGETVTAIGNGAFQQNQLTSVTIPGSVLTIGTTAFQENQLTSITLSEGTTTLSRNAFYGNNLTSVTIPDSVSSIGDYAFYNNPLASASVDSGTSFSHNSFPVGCAIQQR